MGGLLGAKGYVGPPLKLFGWGGGGGGGGGLPPPSVPTPMITYQSFLICMKS